MHSCLSAMFVIIFLVPPLLKKLVGAGSDGLVGAVIHGE